MTRRDPEPPITTYCNNNNNNPLAHKLLTFAATTRAHWRVKLCDFVKPWLTFNNLLLATLRADMWRTFVVEISLILYYRVDVYRVSSSVSAALDTLGEEVRRRVDFTCTLNLFSFLYDYDTQYLTVYTYSTRQMSSNSWARERWVCVTNK